MSYYIIIAASLIIIISYFFTLIEKKKSIPGVLMLISLGIILQLFSVRLGVKDFDFVPILEILGIVGLIMIVLEASLDLDLKRKNLPLILKSFSLAIILLALNTITFAVIFMSLMEMEMITALLYAIPLSIISSAIVIPSVEGLSKKKKEFMIYESAISDILGIMFFFLLIGSVEKEGTQQVLLYIGGNILFTLLISAVVCFGLILLFQKIKSETKLFLFIAILVILYALGKNMYPEAFISPRGLITVLLFYAIPKEYISPDFEEGILLFVILFTSVIMAVALIKHSKKAVDELESALEDQDVEISPEWEETKTDGSASSGEND